METHAFSVEWIDRGAGRAEVRIGGRLALADGLPLRTELERACQSATAEVVFDLARVEAIDGGTTALLLDLEGRLTHRGLKVAIAGTAGSVKALVDLYRARGERAPTLRDPPRRLGTFDQIGRQTIALGHTLRNLLDYIGEVTIELGEAVRHPASVNWRDAARLMERAGADGLPIVATILLLVGLILGFQGAITLKPYGGNIFVADLVALSVTRELGPLIVAIIVAGRSGAAFAAELGTMKVSEEIDALRTLGLSPYKFLVFPRVLALLVAVPILTLLGDAVALLGGFIVGITGLDIAPNAYRLETQNRLVLWDVSSGVLKSVAFGLAIALISCERGLATTGGAEGVGRSTTSSVVTILFHLVVIDFAFTLLYQAFGL